MNDEKNPEVLSQLTSRQLAAARRAGAGAGLAGELKTRRPNKIVLTARWVFAAAPLIALWVGILTSWQVGGLVLLAVVVPVLLAGNFTTAPRRTIVTITAIATMAGLSAVQSVYPISGWALVGMMLLVPVLSILPYVLPRNDVAVGLEPVRALTTAIVSQLGVVAGSVASFYDGWAGLLVVFMVAGLAWLVPSARWWWLRRTAVRAGVVMPKTRLGEATSMSETKFATEWLEKGHDLEVKVGAMLMSVAKGWHVLHSRTLPGTSADVDSLLIGLPGVVTVDSKNITGVIGETLVITEVVTDEGEMLREPEMRWTCNGDEQKLMDLLLLAQFEANTVMRALDVAPEDMSAVIVFGNDMELPEPVLWFQMDATPALHNPDVLLDPINVALVTLDGLGQVVEAMEPRRWKEPSASALAKGLRKGLTEDQVRQASDQRYVDALAVAADVALPAPTRVWYYR